MNTSARTGRKYACRTRLQRVERPNPTVITPRDRQFFVYLLLFSFISTRATFLLARLIDPAIKGMTGWPKRLTALFHAKFVSRFQLQRGYISGSEDLAYVIETGRALAVAERRTDPTTMEAGEWQKILDATVEERRRSLEILSTEGFDRDYVDARLQANTKTAMKLARGLTCSVPHTLLASSSTIALIYSAEKNGWPTGNYTAEGQIDLSFYRCKQEDGICSNVEDHKASHVRVLPDFFWTVTRGASTFGFALEAETGTSSRQKIEEKLRHYLDAWRLLKLAGIQRLTGVSELSSFRVLFIGPRAHLRMIAREIAQLQPKGTGLFLMVVADDISLDLQPDRIKATPEVPATDTEAKIPMVPGKPATPISLDHFLWNEPITIRRGGTVTELPLYDYLRTIATSENFLSVKGTDEEGNPDYKEQPLLPVETPAPA